MTDALDDTMLASIEAEARSFQHQREFDQSIRLWRMLANAAPRREDFAYALAHDLQTAGRIAEANDVYRRSAARFPTSFWIAFSWAISAWRLGSLDDAQLRATLLLPTYGSRPQLNEFLGDIAFRQRRFYEAIKYYQTAEANAAGRAEVKLTLASMYYRLDKGFFPRPLFQQDLTLSADFKAIYINLDSSPDRHERLRFEFRDCPILLERLPAIRGRYLPLAAIESLTMKPETATRKGTVACFLSHVAAWEAVADSGASVCLILEDDAYPIINLPSRFGDLNIPADFDLCFVNKRMQLRTSVEDLQTVERFGTVSLISVLLGYSARDRAPGGDGYFVSASGVSKLLDFVRQDGFEGDIDWRLVYYCIQAHEVERLSADVAAGAMLRSMRIRLRTQDTLKAYCLWPSLINNGSRDSPRGEENNFSPAHISPLN